MEKEICTLQKRLEERNGQLQTSASTADKVYLKPKSHLFNLFYFGCLFEFSDLGHAFDYNLKFKHAWFTIGVSFFGVILINDCLFICFLNYTRKSCPYIDFLKLLKI